MKKINQNDILEHGTIVRHIESGKLHRVILGDPCGLVFLDCFTTGSNIHRDELATDYEVVEFEDFDDDGNYIGQNKASKADCAL